MLRLTFVAAAVLAVSVLAAPRRTRIEHQPVDCTDENIHCITSKGIKREDGILTVPLMYADSTASPTGLECDAAIYSGGKKVGITGNCGATSFSTPPFLVSCRDVQFIDGYWQLVDQQYTSSEIVKVSFDGLNDGDNTWSAWQGEANGPTVEMKDMEEMDFRVVKSSLLSHKYQKAHWVNFFFSKDPGVDMTLGCPRKVFDTKTDNTTTTTEPSPSKKGTTNPNP